MTTDTLEIVLREYDGGCTVTTATGERLGWYDRRAGVLHLDDEGHRDAVVAAVRGPRCRPARVI